MPFNEDIHRAIDDFESIAWLDADFGIDHAKCEEAVRRLREKGVIDEEYADLILCELGHPTHSESGWLAYRLGAQLLVWLAICSNGLGAENPRINEFYEHLQPWAHEATEDEGVTVETAAESNDEEQLQADDDEEVQDSPEASEDMK